MKTALISYHKNISKIYPEQWVDVYRATIKGQSFQDFEIFEVCYGGEKERVFGGSNYIYKEFPTFVHVQNYLLDELFSRGYDCVWNSNVDDYYAMRWMEKTLPYIQMGYDVVGCNFVLFDGVELKHKHQFDQLNIEQELLKDHNVLCHPAIAYNRTFFEKGNRYKPEEIPYEDLRLWQRGLKNSKYFIVPEHLCYHRIHDNSVCQSNNR